MRLTPKEAAAAGYVSDASGWYAPTATKGEYLGCPAPMSYREADVLEMLDKLHTLLPPAQVGPSPRKVINMAIKRLREV